MRPSLAALIAALAAVTTACSTDAGRAGDETSRQAATSAAPTATVPATDEPPSASTTTTPTTPTTTTTTTSTTPTASSTTDTTATTAASSIEECRGEPAEPTTEAYLTVDGVRPDLLSVDVYRPTSAPACPVALWVHGGGWRNGDKRGKGIDTKVAYFAELGYVTVAVNYRLADPANDVRWPTFADDVAAALDWTLDHAVEIGVDPQRVVLIGHSAGAHLVSIVATNPTLLDGVERRRSDIDCVIALDTASYDLADRPGNDGSITLAFGTDPEVLADASPTVQVIEHGGPIADFFVVTRGSSERIAAAEDFASSVEAAGSRVEVIDLRPSSHEEVNTTFGAAGETRQTPAATAFLAGCG